MLVPKTAADEYFDFNETRSVLGTRFQRTTTLSLLTPLSLSVTESSCGGDFVLTMFDITR